MIFPLNHKRNQIITLKTKTVMYFLISFCFEKKNNNNRKWNYGKAEKKVKTYKLNVTTTKYTIQQH